MNSDLDPQPCGLIRRLMCMLYDGLLVIALLIVAAGIALPVTGDSQKAGQDLVYTVYLLVVWFGYLGWCWTRTGQTLGMRAWKCRLSAEDDQPVTWRQCAVRFLVSLVSAAIAGLGFLSSLFRKDRACWHDLASSTRLIRQPSDSD